MLCCVVLCDVLHTTVLYKLKTVKPNISWSLGPTFRSFPGLHTTNRIEGQLDYYIYFFKIYTKLQDPVT